MLISERVWQAFRRILAVYVSERVSVCELAEWKATSGRRARSSGLPDLREQWGNFSTLAGSREEAHALERRPSKAVEAAFHGEISQNPPPDPREWRTKQNGRAQVASRNSDERRESGGWPE